MPVYHHDQTFALGSWVYLGPLSSAVISVLQSTEAEEKVKLSDYWGNVEGLPVFLHYAETSCLSHRATHPSLPELHSVALCRNEQNCCYLCSYKQLQNRLAKVNRKSLDSSTHELCPTTPSELNWNERCHFRARDQGYKTVKLTVALAQYSSYLLSNLHSHWPSIQVLAPCLPVLI